MKPLFIILVVTITWLAETADIKAQGTTAFTYQGQLRDGGTNANGTYGMMFKLFDSAAAGNQVGGTISNSVTLNNGLFSLNLDFGPTAFNGLARWLDITIKEGTNAPENLSPRVQVLPSPYALYASQAGTVTNGAIMSAQIAPGAVATAHIRTGAITAVLIADGSVTNRHLAANAVTGDKIANGTIGGAKVQVPFDVVNNVSNPYPFAIRGEANGGLLTGTGISGTGGNIGVYGSGGGWGVVGSGFVYGGAFFATGPNGIGLCATGQTAACLVGNVQVTNGAYFGNGTGLSNVSAAPRIQLFFANGNFVVPSGVTRIMVEMWGGGGGGGAGYYLNPSEAGDTVQNAGGGGGGGGYILHFASVTSGSTYSVVAGTGGDRGQAGGNATFNGPGISLTAFGGAPGTNATETTAGGGGAPGNASGGYISVRGAPGGDGTMGSDNVNIWSINLGGHGGGSPRGGHGGMGYPFSSQSRGDNPRSGQGPGAGGGGGGGADDPSEQFAGRGSTGVVLIYY